LIDCRPRRGDGAGSREGLRAAALATSVTATSASAASLSSTMATAAAALAAGILGGSQHECRTAKRARTPCRPSALDGKRETVITEGGAAASGGMDCCAPGGVCSKGAECEGGRPRTGLGEGRSCEDGGSARKRCGGMATGAIGGCDGAGGSMGSMVAVGGGGIVGGCRGSWVAELTYSVRRNAVGSASGGVLPGDLVLRRSAERCRFVGRVVRSGVVFGGGGALPPVALPSAASLAGLLSLRVNVA